MKFNDLTISQAIKALKEKQFSSSELLRACLDRIRDVEPKLNAFITISEKEALEQAKDADFLMKDTDSSEWPSLLGIPIALKDLFSTRGIKTTAASKVLENYLPVYDATTVERLKEAGAVIIGKTNCDAWAHGSSGENSDFGITHNPFDLEKVPGGSSSGSAVAVAANECLAAMGTDTGGSIRQPAAFCNLVGLKPTYGRVSRYGVIAMASSLDSIGHLTKDVLDSALMLQVTAGYDPRDATTSNVPVPEYQDELGKGIEGMKIGIPQEYFIKGLDPEIREQTDKAVKRLVKLGAQVDNVSLPHTEESVAVYYIIVPSEISSNLARYDGFRYGHGREQFGDEAKRRIILGTYTLSAGYYDAYYLKAMKVRTLIKNDFEEAFKKFDALITPVFPSLPFNLGEKVNDPLSMYLSDIFTIPANLAGIPGLSFPIGWLNNLPVGMQVLGPQFSEKTLLRIAFAFEQEAKVGKGEIKL